MVLFLDPRLLKYSRIRKKYVGVMESYKYLIIGNGVSADAAVNGIREMDTSGRIGILGEEPYPTYSRSLLSKGLWLGAQPSSLWRSTYKENVVLHLNTKAISIDPDNHIVLDSAGVAYSYEKLLIATGGTPKHLPCPCDGVIYLHNLSDYYKLRSYYDCGERFVVVGCGYTGSEIAAALAMNGKSVTMIFPEPYIGYQKFPKKFSTFLNTYYQEQGVSLICEQSIASVNREKETFIVKTTKGEVLEADGVVVGMGNIPATELALSAKLSVDDGIVVNNLLQTSNPDIFSSGDVANFYNPLLDKRLRAEHASAAVTMGKVAGRNMAGALEEYSYLPYAYSEFFEIGFDAIGEISSDMEIVEDWDELYRKGIIYYLRDGFVRGGVAVGMWDKMDTIRKMIASKEKLSVESRSSG